MKLFSSPLLLIWISVFAIAANAQQRDRKQQRKNDLKAISEDGSVSTDEQENKGVDDQDEDDFDYRNRSPERRKHRNYAPDRKRPFNRENDTDLDSSNGSFPSRDRKHKHWKKKKHSRKHHPDCKHHHHHRHHHHHHHPHEDKHYRHRRPHHRKHSHSDEDIEDDDRSYKHRYRGPSSRRPGEREQNPRLNDNDATNGSNINVPET